MAQALSYDRTYASTAGWNPVGVLHFPSFTFKTDCGFELRCMSLGLIRLDMKPRFQ